MVDADNTWAMTTRGRERHVRDDYADDVNDKEDVNDVNHEDDANDEDDVT